MLIGFALAFLAVECVDAEMPASQDYENREPDPILNYFEDNFKGLNRSTVEISDYNYSQFIKRQTSKV